MRIYFHNDLDGRAAAAIAYRATKVERVKVERVKVERVKKVQVERVKKVQVERVKRVKVELIEMDYKDNVDIEKIEIGEKIIIVDFSFKPEVMEKVLLLTKDIIWIDHHKTAFGYKYSRELKKGLRDNAYSGCELAWKYFYGEEPMPRAVELIGDRDKWCWKFRSETANFNAGLLLYNHQPKDEIWDILLNIDGHIPVTHLRKHIVDIKEEGEICLKFRDQFCNDYARSYGFETVFGSYKCFALGLYMFGSEAFGDRMDKYDICLSFEYLGDGWIIGLYSKTVDVSKIAQKYGGGGHKFAAGFSASKLPFGKNRVLPLRKNRVLPNNEGVRATRLSYTSKKRWQVAGPGVHRRGKLK